MKTWGVTTLAALVLFTLSVPALAIDGGVNIDNVTELYYDSALDIGQADKVSLWFRTDLGSNLKFTAQGSYTYTLDEPYFFDLDLLTLAGSFPPRQDERLLFEFTLGRFLLRDFTGNLLSHIIDGFHLGFRLPWLNLSAALAYSGLQFKADSSIVVSKADYSDLGDPEIILAAPRLIGAAHVNLMDIIPGQDIDLSYLVQLDMRPLIELNRPPAERDLLDEGEIAFSATQGGLLNTHYTGIGFSGTIISPFYYDIFGYLGLGKTLSYLTDEDSATGFSYRYADILSVMTGGGVRVYLEKALYSIIGTRVLFASGDPDYASFLEGNREGRSGMFIPLSSRDTGLVFSPVLANIIIPQLSYSLIPFTNFQTELQGLLFLRHTLGPIQEERTDSIISGRYLGTEIDVHIKYRPFSDLGAGISAGVFLPGGGGVVFGGKFEFSLSI